MRDADKRCVAETLTAIRAAKMLPAIVENPLKFKINIYFKQSGGCFKFRYLVMTAWSSDGVSFLIYGLMRRGASARPRKTFPAAIMDSQAVDPSVT